MAESAQEKTEEPTPRRLQEARDEGNVARSMDLTAAFSLLAAVLLLYAFGGHVFRGLINTMHDSLGGGGDINTVSTDTLELTIARVFRSAVDVIAPLILGITGVALLATVAQVGFLVTTKPLEPNLNKLNPIKGAGNLFNARAGIRLIMSLAKVAVLTLVAFIVIERDLPKILLLAHLEPGAMFQAASGLVFDLALKLAILLLVLGVIDYLFQKQQRTRDLRMSKQDVKEEMKRMEGDPMVKQRRSRVAKQLTMQRTAAAVPQADVVVTNPTHYAIALKYDSQKMAAPRVVAKGADFMAYRIRQIAIAHGVPLVERKELARAMYASVEVGDEVPPEFYNAVAEILAYVYRLSGAATA